MPSLEDRLHLTLSFAPNSRKFRQCSLSHPTAKTSSGLAVHALSALSGLGADWRGETRPARENKSHWWGNNFISR